MASPLNQLHFVPIPLRAQGHVIPMIDMARLFAERGVNVSLVTIPHHAARFATIIDRALKPEVGLPMGCENLDIVPSRDLIRNFYKAIDKLQEPLEQYLQEQKPLPSCIISDKCLYWTAQTVRKFQILRTVFHGMCCFSLLSSHNVQLYNAHNSVASNSEPFVVQGMPLKFEITRAQLPGSFVTLPDLDDIPCQMQEAESTAYGVVVNSFNELEHGCAEEYQRALGKKVWCIGLVSLCNKENLDMFERGNKASIDDKQCLGWLVKPRSIVYACLGSQCRLVASQLIQLGLGLEASKHPFVWVVKTGEEIFHEVEKWLLEEEFEERIKGRGLLIKGWAPQFFNEKLIVEILRIGVRVGVDVPVRWGEEEKDGVSVHKGQVEMASDILMDGGEEGEERRKKALELGEMARRSMEEGGSSHSNMLLLIQDIIKQFTGDKSSCLQ
ncbi:hypothetical protein L1049_007670 [Liquidambar formosana]|uniref:Uncharacterized protein n=1 Tax=Liquidambar formosana TaxID=63359 RepID=A0AAP0S280_LIQFO